MTSIAEAFNDMQLPPEQGVIESPMAARTKWLDKAAFALYEARRSEFPEAFPLPWDVAPRSVRQDFRYLAMAAYRRSLPLVRDVLIEMVAQAYANLEGWIYPDCDNKAHHDVRDRDRPAMAAQRRQQFRHKAEQLLTTINQYLEIDCDTEPQRQKTVDRIAGQLEADRQVVSLYRSRRGIPTQVNHG